MKQERGSENDIRGAIIKRFVIEGAFYGDKCFPGLNDMLHEAERHPNAYNKMKKHYETLAVNAIRRHLKGFKASGIVVPHYEFGEPKKGKKRDYDNIASAARKIINDALERTGTIHDDSPRYLGYGTNKFVYSDTPYIDVCLYVETQDS